MLWKSLLGSVQVGQVLDEWIPELLQEALLASPSGLFGSPNL